MVFGDVPGHRGTRIADDAVAGALRGDDLGGRFRRLVEFRNLRFRQGAVQRISGGHGADQDQHDKTHALLTVVGTVREADAGAGGNQKTANPERRSLVAFGRRI